MADLAPMCSMYDTLAPCAESDQGKPCPSGGSCYKISCVANAMLGQPIYKCAACPSLVAEAADAGDGGNDAGAACGSFSDMGKACGEGDKGHCVYGPSYCNADQPKALRCYGPVPELPAWDGGTPGEAGADANPDPVSNDAGSSDAGTNPTPPPAEDDGGGCTVASSTQKTSYPGMLTPLLFAAGIAAMLFDRRRRNKP